MKGQLCISVTETDIQSLRELAIEMGFTFGNRGGSISALIRYIADRYTAGDKLFGGATFEESVFNSLLELAESLQSDCGMCEDEVVEILRKAATRSFNGLQSQALDNIILDIRAILFGDN
ncbi:MAG: hypothetical protein KAV87_00455 [Desulfobacteraceae bacterium]|nr:hypothetical protein [Desulfobacteraceae bacterium]